LIVPVNVLHHYKKCSEKELKMLFYLQKAVNLINAIYVDMLDSNFFVVLDVIHRVFGSSILTSEERSKLEEYNTILHVHNSFWPYGEDASAHLNISSERLHQLFNSVGISNSEQSLVVSYMTKPIKRSLKGKYYPEDLTDEELHSFGEEGELPNTIILKDKSSGNILVPLELYYKCMIIIRL
jgi:hypothetical protein